MIVIPIQFIIALVLGGIGLVLLIITHIANYVRKAIRKWRMKKNGRREYEEDNR